MGENCQSVDINVYFAVSLRKMKIKCGSNRDSISCKKILFITISRYTKGSKYLIIWAIMVQGNTGTAKAELTIGLSSLLSCP